MDRPVFTSHNIEFPDGQRTIPEQPLLAEGSGVAAILRTLDLAFGADPHSTKTIVDLGCLEGGYTVEFARAGYDATGIEVRRINMEKCEFVAEQVALPNLRFVEDDAHNIAKHGPFDAIFCSGLLYHLDDPAAYLRVLAENTRRVLILHTHYSARRRPPKWRMYPPHRLSRMVTHEGNRGRWYREFRPSLSQEKVERAVWASFGNSRSFWIEKFHLLQTLQNVGFQLIYEQYDAPDIATDPYIRQNHRSMFVAVH